MDTMEQAYRPLTLPMHQNETSLMRVRPEGLLSASPLRFQPGLVKVPEGIHHPLLETSTQQLSGRYRQTFIAVHEAASFWYPPRLRLPVRFPMADEMTQEEQRKVRSVWAMLGYTVGAGAVVMLYVLITSIGISAYFPLISTPQRLAPPTLPALWKATIGTQIDHIAHQLGKPVILSEVGYRNSTDALYQPWTSMTRATPDPQEQAAAYNAALQDVMSDSLVRGIYFWAWSVPIYQPNNLPAAHVLLHWYSICA